MSTMGLTMLFPFLLLHTSVKARICYSCSALKLNQTCPQDALPTNVSDVFSCVTWILKRNEKDGGGQIVLRQTYLYEEQCQETQFWENFILNRYGVGGQMDCCTTDLCNTVEEVLEQNVADNTIPEANINLVAACTKKLFLEKSNVDVATQFIAMNDDVAASVEQSAARVEIKNGTATASAEQSVTTVTKKDGTDPAIADQLAATVNAKDGTDVAGIKTKEPSFNAATTSDVKNDVVMEDEMKTEFIDVGQQTDLPIVQTQFFDQLVKPSEQSTLLKPSGEVVLPQSSQESNVNSDVYPHNSKILIFYVKFLNSKIGNTLGIRLLGGNLDTSKEYSIEMEQPAPTQQYSGTDPLQQKTVPIAQQSSPLNQQTVLIEQASLPLEQLSTALEQQSVPLEQLSVPLQKPSVPLQQPAVPLQQQSVSLQQQSVPIEQLPALQQQSEPLKLLAESPIQQLPVPLKQQSAPLKELSESLSEQLPALLQQQQSLPLEQLADHLPALQQQSTPLEQLSALQQQSTPLEQLPALQQQSTPLGQLPTIPRQSAPTDQLSDFPTQQLPAPPQQQTTSDKNVNHLSSEATQLSADSLGHMIDASSQQLLTSDTQLYESKDLEPEVVESWTIRVYSVEKDDGYVANNSSLLLKNQISPIQKDGYTGFWIRTNSSSIELGLLNPRMKNSLAEPVVSWFDWTGWIDVQYVGFVDGGAGAFIEFACSKGEIDS